MRREHAEELHHNGGGGSGIRLLETASLQVKGMIGVEVAGIEPVRTVWNHRNPLVASASRRVPSDLVGFRRLRLLTPSTSHESTTVPALVRSALVVSASKNRCERLAEPWRANPVGNPLSKFSRSLRWS